MTPVRPCLPDLRLPLLDGSVLGVEFEISFVVDANAVDTFESNPDIVGIRSRTEDEVIFGMLLVTMKNGAYARIDRAITYALVVGNTADPLVSITYQIASVTPGSLFSPFGAFGVDPAKRKATIFPLSSSSAGPSRPRSITPPRVRARYFTPDAACPRFSSNASGSFP